MREDDAHLQTLCRMSDSNAATLEPGTEFAAQPPARRVFQYYNDMNALSLLSEAIGRPHRRRLVHVDLEGSLADSVVQRELFDLDDEDRAYLARRKVHELPPEHSRSVPPPTTSDSGVAWTDNSQVIT